MVEPQHKVHNKDTVTGLTSTSMWKLSAGKHSEKTKNLSRIICCSSSKGAWWCHLQQRKAKLSFRNLFKLLGWKKINKAQTVKFREPKLEIVDAKKKRET